MASLKKRGNYYSIVFKKSIEGKPVSKTYALGVKYKDTATDKKRKYEKLYQKDEIDPFDKRWNLKDYEESLKTSDKPSYAGSYLIEDFKKEFIKTKSHTSAHNLRAYRSVIKLLKEHVGQTMPVNRIEPSDIRTFCFQDRFSNATKRNYLSYLKTFFNWMVKNEIIDESPCKEVSPPQQRDKLVEKIIRERQLNEVINKFRKIQHKKRKENHLHTYLHMKFWFKPIITTAFYTGLRRKELLQLRWEHIHLEEREVHVTDTKTGSERSVILFDPAYRRLKAWHRFLGNPVNGLAFPSPKSSIK